MVIDMKSSINKETISFIIPCYQSEKTISKVVEGIKEEIQRDYNYRIILVDDASPDGVFQVITKLCEKDKNIIGLSLSKNFGQQAARMAAIPYIVGDYVVFMDDDGQHASTGIIKLIEKIKTGGYDIVYAKFKFKKESLFKQFGSWLNLKMTDILIGKPKEVRQSSFFAMRYFVAKELENYKSPFPYLFGYLMKITQNIANVEIEHLPRITGNTGYTFKKLIMLWLNGFTGFSVVPLRVSSLLGVASAMLGFLWGIMIIIRKLMVPDVAMGYSSIMAVILFMGGIIMVMLGLLGEYIGRAFITINQIPQYVIKEQIVWDEQRAREESKNCSSGL